MLHEARGRAMRIMSPRSPPTAARAASQDRDPPKVSFASIENSLLAVGVTGVRHPSISTHKVGNIISAGARGLDPTRDHRFGKDAWCVRKAAQHPTPNNNTKREHHCRLEWRKVDRRHRSSQSNVSATRSLSPKMSPSHGQRSGMQHACYIPDQLSLTRHGVQCTPSDCVRT